jgi:hypothetical protein
MYKDCHDWLARLYFEDGGNQVLRTVIDAIGMAGISNISYAPSIAAKSRDQYSRALAATKQLLNDPVRATADETLMAVILLDLFEVT